MFVFRSIQKLSTTFSVMTLIWNFSISIHMDAFDVEISSLFTYHDRMRKIVQKVTSK